MMKRTHKEPLMQNAKVQEVASKHNKAAAEVSRLLMIATTEAL